MIALEDQRCTGGMAVLQEIPPMGGRVFSTVATRRRELVDAWLAGKNVNTIRNYTAKLAQLAEFTGHAEPGEAADYLFSLEAGDANYLVLRFREHLESKGLAPSSVALALNAIKSLAKVARMLGLCDFTIEVSSGKVETLRDTRGPGEAGFTSMWTAAAADDSDQAVRDHAILRLLHDMALRRGEMISLDIEDIERDEAGPYALHVVGKGKRDKKRLSIPKHTAAVLRKWIERRGETPGPLFRRLDNAAVGDIGRLTGQAVSLIVGRWSDRAGLTRKCKPHGLRHAGITLALDVLNGDVRKAAQFSRHAKLDTVLRYDDDRRDVFGQVAEMVAEMVAEGV